MILCDYLLTSEKMTILSLYLVSQKLKVNGVGIMKNL